MARTIGLNIVLNGVPTVITSLEELETQIKLAQDQLKTLAIGSDEFKKLSAEVQVASSKFKTLQESIEGKGLEQRSAAFAKVGEGITTSFAAAQAAIGLFGSKSEDVAKAAAKAQALLTIAIAARGVAEGAANVKIVANTIATAAQTAATTAANAATKAFYTTLAANPYGAILAVIGALIAAVVLLGDSEEETAEKTKSLSELQIEQAQAAEVETSKIIILTKVLKDGNASLLAKQGAYLQLQKLVPTLTNLTLEQAQAQGVLNGYIEDEITLIDLRAKAKALEDFLTQQKKEEIADQVKLNETKRVAAVLDAQLAKGKLMQRGGTAAEGEAEYQRVLKLNMAKIGAVKVEDQLIEVQTQIAELEGKRQLTIDKQKQSTDALNKSEEARNKQLQALIQLLGTQAKLQAELLTQTFKLGEADTEIVSSTQAKVDKAKEYASQLNQLKSFTVLLQEAQDSLVQSEDLVGEAFQIARSEGEKYFNVIKAGGNSKDAIKALDSAVVGLKESFKDVLNEEQLTQLDNYILNYKQFTQTVEQFQKVNIKPPFNAAEFEKALIDLQLATGQINVDPFERTPEKLAEAKQNAEIYFKEIEKRFIDAYTQSEIQKNKEKLTGLSGEDLAKLKEQYAEAGQIAFENLTQTGEEIIKFENGVERVNIKVGQLNAELAKLSGEALQGFLLANKEALTAQYEVNLDDIAKNREKLNKLTEQTNKKLYDKEGEFRNDVLDLEKQLLQQGIDISTLSYEAKLELLKSFLAKEVDETEKAEKTKQEKQQESLQKLEEGFAAFSDITNQIAGLVRESISFQLDQLETQTEQTLSKIVGDSEEANAKRLEVEKIYEQKKKELEKQGTLAELGFSLANASVNVAEAITKALTAGPIAGQILAGITAAIGLVQIGLIGKQINAVSSMARGGIISGAGGLLVGPSHEQGGIRYGAMGLELEGGETVVNKYSTIKYQNLLSQVNQSGGGQPIIASVNNGLAEDRLLQALAKQNDEPIRAYVLEQDITSKQAITRRLEQLAQL